jgi:hypothetical protein
MARIRLSDELRALLEEARTSGSLSLSELASQPSLSPNAAAFDEESLRILREEEASGALSTKSLRLLHAALRNHPKIASNDTSGSNDQSPGNQTTMLRAIAAGSKARAGENQSERLLLFPKSVRSFSVEMCMYALVFTKRIFALMIAGRGGGGAHHQTDSREGGTPPAAAEDPGDEGIQHDGLRRSQVSCIGAFSYRLARPYESIYLCIVDVFVLVILAP